MYTNTPKIRRISGALGIAKLEQSLTKIILLVVQLVLPISESDGNTVRTVSAIAEEHIVFPGRAAKKSRSEWAKKSLSLWHYQPQKDCVQKKSPNCLTHC